MPWTREVDEHALHGHDGKPVLRRPILVDQRLSGALIGTTSLAEYVAVREDRALVLTPENVTFAEAAAVPVAILYLYGQRYLVGGLTVGILQQIANYLVGGVFVGVVTFALFIIVLVLMPQGLFGSTVARRV